MPLGFAISSLSFFGIGLDSDGLRFLALLCYDLFPLSLSQRSPRNLPLFVHVLLPSRGACRFLLSAVSFVIFGNVLCFVFVVMLH